MFTVNGKKQALPEEMSLAAFLEKEHYNPVLVAVELNGHIVSRERYKETMLHDGDVLEVVSFMGGG